MITCIYSQLIDDKKNLSEKCENLVKELKQVDKKYQDKLKSLTDKYVDSFLLLLSFPQQFWNFCGITGFVFEIDVVHLNVIVTV